MIEDQYALQIAHPTGILSICSIIARHSRRFALFLVEGLFDPFGLYVLILTYTSIADTSLQLLCQFKFSDINELNVYLSPDILNILVVII